MRRACLYLSPNLDQQLHVSSFGVLGSVLDWFLTLECQWSVPATIVRLGGIGDSGV